MVPWYFLVFISLWSEVKLSKYFSQSPGILDFLFRQRKINSETLCVTLYEMYRQVTGISNVFFVLVKPGRCPEMPNSMNYSCPSKCKTDADCRGDMKCCGMGCGKRCIPANNPGKKGSLLCLTRNISVQEQWVPGRCRKLCEWKTFFVSELQRTFSSISLDEISMYCLGSEMEQ